MAEVHPDNVHQEQLLEDTKQYILGLLGGDQVSDMMADIIGATIGRSIPRDDEDEEWYATHGAIMTKLLARCIDDLYYPAAKQ